MKSARKLRHSTFSIVHYPNSYKWRTISKSAYTGNFHFPYTLCISEYSIYSISMLIFRIPYDSFLICMLK